MIGTRCTHRPLEHIVHRAQASATHRAPCMHRPLQHIVHRAQASATHCAPCTGLCNTLCIVHAQASATHCAPCMHRPLQHIVCNAQPFVHCAHTGLCTPECIIVFVYYWYIILSVISYMKWVTRHFQNGHFQANFLIGCSDKLAGVDIRFGVIWATGI